MRPASNMPLEWRTPSRLPFEVVTSSRHIIFTGASVERLSFCGVANVIDTHNVDRSAGTRLNLRIKVAAE